jgi:hypothetical protein
MQELGLRITSELVKLAKNLNLSRSLGTAPHDLFLERYPYGHRKSVRTEWAQKVLGSTIQDKDRPVERVIIVQSGSLRFDIVRYDRPHSRESRLITVVCWDLQPG